MGTILHIDASARLERSLSRRLSRTFVDEWTALHPSDLVIHRDVGRSPPPHVTEAWIAAAFTPPGKRTPDMRDVLAASDALVAEVTASDLIVMGVPMYNYGMPSTLKAWIDQVARVGETFSFDLARGDFPIEGTLSGKKLVVLSARASSASSAAELASRGTISIPISPPVLTTLESPCATSISWTSSIRSSAASDSSAR